MKLLPAEFRLSRPPDMELVGYLHRWCLVPRSRAGNRYLHAILAGDEPVLHDHPWDFSCRVLSGGYVEITPEGRFERRTGAEFRKKATDLHYIETVEPDTWTVITTGPTCRDWGFATESGWVSHEQYEGRRIEIVLREGYAPD